MHTATVNTAFSGTPDTTGITSAIATAKVIPTTTVIRTATATTTTKKKHSSSRDVLRYGV